MRTNIGLAVAVCAGLCFGMPSIVHAQDAQPESGQQAKPKHEVPPVFSKLTFDEAMKQAKDADKVLVVKFTAEWCGPCKMMDRTTWRDERVEKWVKDNAVAIQVDVDKDRKVAEQNNISAMPTMIAFRKGEMVERTVGYRTADQLLPWLERAKNGEQKVAGLEAIALPPDDKPEDGSKRMDMRERMNSARDLVDAEKFDNATKEYLWLWKNMLAKQPSMYGVRLSYMAGDMTRLADKHKPAKDAFIQLRDETETRLKSPEKTFDDLIDWMVLNDVIGQDVKTLEWYDRVKNDPDVGPTFDRVDFHLVQILEKHERWADLGKLTKDPVGKVRDDHAMWAQIPQVPNADAEMKAHLKQLQANNFRTTTSRIYAGQLAAGRDGEADKVLAEAIKLDDTPEMRVALVKMAIKVGQPRQSHGALLEETAKKNEDAAQTLRDLRKALADRAG